MTTRLTYIVLFLLTLGFLAAPLRAADGPTPYPDPKDDAAWPGKGPIRMHGWMVDNRNAFWTRRDKDQDAVVFVGDSLVGGWKSEWLAKAFPNLKIANRGIGGDVSRGLLFRFKEDVLDLKPKAIVLCIGTNDLSTHADPAVTELNIAAILAQAREYSATMPIVLCQIPPRDVKGAPTKPGALADLNARIAALAKAQEHVAVLNLFTLLATPEGKPTPEYFGKDLIHISKAGFEKWAEALGNAFKELGVE